MISTFAANMANNRIEELLKAKGISQAALGRLMNPHLNRDTIGLKINGKREFTIEEGWKVCEALNEPFEKVFPKP